jgi:8-oxo-dGTP diphosphatase
MRRWTVGGALIRVGDGLLLVANRRRDQSVEWTPPGGVIDTGETVLVGLAREVFEETGLRVTGWSRLVYTVVVDAPDMGWQLRVEAWEAEGTEGDIVLADPDGIVEHARHVDAAEALELLVASPPWVRDPVGDWLSNGTLAQYRYLLRGHQRGAARIERIE